VCSSDLAKLALNEKDMEAAIISLRIVNKESPENIDAYLLLASVYLYEKNDEQLKVTLNTAFENKDYEGANFYVSNLAGRTISEPPLQLAQTAKEEILLQANVRMLGVFFWFILLGPVGAVLYRLSSLLKNNQQDEDDDFANASRDLYMIMNWLPARICVLSYAVAGNFVDTMSYWNGLSDLWLRDREEFIVVSGVGALRYEQRMGRDEHDDEPDIAAIQNALTMVKRAGIVWVVLRGLLTVTGWLV